LLAGIIELQNVVSIAFGLIFLQPSFSFALEKQLGDGFIKKDTN